MTHNKYLSSLLKTAGVLSAIAVVSFAAHQSLNPGRLRPLSLSLSQSESGKDGTDLYGSRTADPQSKEVIARMWHGRVLTSRADEYYAYLKEAGINKIEAIEGNLGAQVFRRNNGKETEFTVISYWESRDAIKKFAGDDIEKTHFLPKDKEYLLELEPTVNTSKCCWTVESRK